MSGWYWCLTHERVESAADRDDMENALGPYPTAEAARDWKERVEQRNAEWKQEDERWGGDEDDGDDGDEPDGDD